MPRIPVGNLFALVDDADYAWLSEYKWYPNCNNHQIYANRRDGVMMHQLITGFDLTDHHNGDGLDNRRENLREASKALNGANQNPQVGCSSRFKGVAWDASRSKWKAYVKVDGKIRNLGRFSDEIDAAKTYNAAALEAWGEFALINDLEA